MCTKIFSFTSCTCLYVCMQFYFNKPVFGIMIEIPMKLSKHFILKWLSDHLLDIILISIWWVHLGEMNGLSFCLQVWPSCCCSFLSMQWFQWNKENFRLTWWSSRTNVWSLCLRCWMEWRYIHTIVEPQLSGRSLSQVPMSG